MYIGLVMSSARTNQESSDTSKRPFGATHWENVGIGISYHPIKDIYFANGRCYWPHQAREAGLIK